MLKKIVLLVAVISGASSVSFGAAGAPAAATKSFSQKMKDLRDLRKDLADAKKNLTPEVSAAEITRLEGVVAAAQTALDAAHQAHDAAVTAAERILGLDQEETINGTDYTATDDTNRNARTAAVTAAQAPIKVAQDALTAAETALRTARQNNSNRADLVQAEKDAADALKDADVNTFAVKAGIAAVDTNEFLFVSRNGKKLKGDLRYAGTTLKTLTTVATALVGAALGKKVVAAFKSADVKAAVGLKAKAKAFGKALNLAPRQSKLLYGSLVTALVATGANYGLAHFDATKAY